MSRSSVNVQIRGRLIGGLCGSLLRLGANLSAELAWAHARALGHICGAAQSPHCGWCYAAVGLAMAGLAAVAASRADRVKARI